MSSRPRLPARLLAVLLLGVAVGAGAQTGTVAPPTPDTRATQVTRASGRCGVCHPADRAAFEHSLHAREDVRCVSCHGGDDTTLEKAAAHGRGFTGKVDRGSIPQMCGGCHSDVEKMRPYDLPVDQYALYQTSDHGKRLRAGDRAVAVCSDCHGPHDVLAPSDPSSKVFPTNIPRTCGACHGDSTLMRSRKLHDTYREYLTSVHARALFDKGNLRAPTCVSCHGVHGAAPPQTGDVNKVCGKCHTAERRYFNAGRHRGAMADQKVSECASCHGDHAIPAAQPMRLAKSCVDCHDDRGKEAVLGQELLADYQRANDELDKADALIARADAVPLQTDDYKARLEEARTYLREAMTATHTVQPDVVSGFSLRAHSVGTEIQSEIQGKLGNIRTAKLLLILFWFYVLVTAGILYRIRDRRRPSR